jgi:hypothetical protein
MAGVGEEEKPFNAEDAERKREIAEGNKAGKERFPNRTIRGFLRVLSFSPLRVLRV